MRATAPDERPVVLTVAGSDSGGGAGIQADVKTIEATGGFATSVVTSVTAQHTRGVESTHVLPVAEVRAQLDAVFDDFDVRAVKTGMLATAEIVDCVAERARETDVPFVVDPVMVAASGDRLLEPAAEDAYRDLLAAATLVTPNADEAAVLTGIDPDDEADLRRVGERLVADGAEAALVKGGHVDGDPVTDVLVRGAERGNAADGGGGSDGGEGGGTTGREDDGGERDRTVVETVSHERVDTDATHGSGCTLSSSIAARLAGGATLSAAVAGGIDHVARAVRYPLAVGRGPGAVHHTVELRDEGARERTREALVAVRESEPFAAVGESVAVATPYAESPAGVVSAVDDGIAGDNRALESGGDDVGVVFGRETPVVDALLAARERAPTLRVAVTVTHEGDVTTAVDTLGWETVSVEGSDETGDTLADSGMAAGDGTGAPHAVRLGGDESPAVVVVAPDSERLHERLTALVEAADSRREP
ncbi:bifunctional hydroxymethylpyrimidine kinase/phosphomethylpyrimidine kinase [Halobaculum sp. MBLA0147]|uniref:bifunctional hydroxymethylpyrimidine kinase/phosphomethylpyrimidine kinase n=1 Tax=Halobaculum sp. MBLA0147 TaxID=3079934 RepID=UPI003523DDBA